MQSSGLGHMLSSTWHLKLSKRCTWDKTAWFVGSPLEIINCDVPAASIHGFKEGTSGHVADGHKPSTTTHSYTSTLPSLGLLFSLGPLLLLFLIQTLQCFSFLFPKTSLLKVLLLQSPLPLSLSQTGISCGWPNLPNINQVCVNYSIVCLLSDEIYCF